MAIRLRTGGLFLACVIAMQPISREASAELEYRPEWRRFQPLEYAVTGGLLASTAVIILVGKSDEPQWAGPILFDEPARSALRASTAAGRRRAQMVGNVAYYSWLAYPYVVDVLALALLRTDHPTSRGRCFS